MAHLSIGQTIDGKYQILSVLGAGGMGTVYHAYQKELSRNVAIKVLNQGMTDPASMARFEREARVMGTLADEHIVAVYNVGLLENQAPYMVIEYLEGKVLSDVLERETRLDWRRAGKIIMQVCHAAQVAHKAGIIHRDLKPQNIFLLEQPETDFVKVLDFGLSRLLPDSEKYVQQLTQTGALIGSVIYMSPELCAGLKADSRSDVYSIGCILYELITGQQPIQGDHPIAMLHLHQNQLPARFSQIAPQCEFAPVIEQITFKAMQKSPDDRFQSAQDFLDAIHLALKGNIQDINLGSVTMTKLAAQSSARSFKAISLSFLLVAIVIIALAFGYNKIISPGTSGPPSESLKSLTPLAKRNADIDSANELMNEVASALSTGNSRRASIAARKVLQVLSNLYPPEAQTYETSMKQLVALERFSQLLSAMEFQESTNTLGDVESIRRGMVLLNRKEQGRESLAYARILKSFKEDNKAAYTYLEAAFYLQGFLAADDLEAIVKEANSIPLSDGSMGNGMKQTKSLLHTILSYKKNDLKQARVYLHEAVSEANLAFPRRGHPRFGAYLSIVDAAKLIGDDELLKSAVDECIASARYSGMDPLVSRTTNLKNLNVKVDSYEESNGRLQKLLGKVKGTVFGTTVRKALEEIETERNDGDSSHDSLHAPELKRK